MKTFQTLKAVLITTALAFTGVAQAESFRVVDLGESEQIDVNVLTVSPAEGVARAGFYTIQIGSVEMRGWPMLPYRNVNIGRNQQAAQYELDDIEQLGGLDGISPTQFSQACWTFNQALKAGDNDEYMTTRNAVVWKIIDPASVSGSSLQAFYNRAVSGDNDLYNCDFKAEIWQTDEGQIWITDSTDPVVLLTRRVEAIEAAVKAMQ